MKNGDRELRSTRDAERIASESNRQVKTFVQGVTAAAVGAIAGAAIILSKHEQARGDGLVYDPYCLRFSTSIDAIQNDA
jgi:hypothetical protein